MHWCFLQLQRKFDYKNRKASNYFLILKKKPPLDMFVNILLLINKVQYILLKGKSSCVPLWEQDYSVLII